MNDWETNRPVLAEVITNTAVNDNNNSAIANRLRVSCAHSTLSESIGLITHDFEIKVKGH